MTKITNETMAHLADQSRIYLSNEEMDHYMHELNETLAFVDKINELSTDDVTPTTNGNQNLNVVREDKPVKWEYRDQAFENAPKHDGAHFEVPTIMD